MTQQAVKDAVFSLDYVSGQLKVYGEKNDYDHDLLLRHIEDVVKKIQSDKSS